MSCCDENLEIEKWTNFSPPTDRNLHREREFPVFVPVGEHLLPPSSMTALLVTCSGSVKVADCPMGHEDASIAFRRYGALAEFSEDANSRSTGRYCWSLISYHR